MFPEGLEDTPLKVNLIIFQHGVKFTCYICGKDSSSMKALDIHKKAKHDMIK
jgi:hypothetical protein